jgi:2-oxoglutarate dehydrogenase E2 component (dihydrolipoamide succinyltransferase)
LPQRRLPQSERQPQDCTVIEVHVPSLPESVADATLVAWHKQPGDAVERDENLADLETDKVVLQVPAPVAGVLREVKVAAGAPVISGTLLAVIEAGAAANANATEAPRLALGAMKVESANHSPAPRHIVDKHEVDPATIVGSGRGDGVTAQDAVCPIYAKYAPATGAPAVTSQPAPTESPAALRTGRIEQRVAMTRLRGRIVARLAEARATQALLTTFNEVDMKALSHACTRYKDRFENTHGVRLGFMPFFVKAAVAALRKFANVNAYVDGADIVYHDYYDVGVAVATDRGLILPVLRNADLMSVADVERAIGAYAQKARDGTITLEELTGGTFSITNGGGFGSLMSTPIVNSPQSAILGMHKVQERPVVVDGQIVIRPMMYLALTYDHRIIDGREAVRFLVTVKDCLEDPTRLLLQV